MAMTNQVELLVKGSRRALARTLTLIENQHPQAQATLAQLYPHTGKAWILGVTGAPGTGKSSLVNALTKALREQEKTVAIIAVDPTSPFSGGAILGDRIRMQDLSGDKGVFIRSMATRGSLGGVATATRDMVRVLDAAGFDYVIVETVGAGQSEVDIVRTAYTTLVIEAPGLGDDVQAIKAGILEIADILVVNKADRNGADQTVRSLRAMLELGHPASWEQFVSHHGRLMETPTMPSTPSDVTLWIPPVLKTSAIQNEGITELVIQIEKHRQHLTESGTVAQLEARYIEIELYERLQQALMRQVTSQLSESLIQTIINQIRTREIDPQTAVNQLLVQLN
ncbi:MAG: methylmalonyl Co-A mutase-associated GTPase MeaB [Anaerolineae bacterium]|nr:methylmalonyl Co-A mutase-associated GTPase MeaB [Anaerolineae bacterium]MDQ7036233.1 methylmalonyl Co-A mutase-associated GTPase MeaB [Anaerolineae bacterium]